MADTTLTSHVLAIQDNSVLLVRHGEAAGHLTGVYGIPGGHVDGSEDFKQTASREFQEETGLFVAEKDLQEFPDNEYTAGIQRKDGTTRRYTMHIFLAKKYEGQLKATEETIPEWVKMKDLKKINLLPNVDKAIQAGLKFLKK